MLLKIPFQTRLLITITGYVILLLLLPAHLSQAIFWLTIFGFFTVGLTRLFLPILIRVSHRLIILCRRVGWTRGLTLTACAFMIASAKIFSQPTSRENPETAVILMGIGAILLWLALWRQPISLPVAQNAESDTALEWKLIALGAVGLALLAEFNANHFEILPYISPDFQVGLFGVSLMLIMLGGYKSFPSWEQIKAARFEILIVTGITVLALILRLWQLNSSIRVFVDEMLFVNGLRYFREADNPTILTRISANAPFPMLYIYGQQWGVETFGRDFFGLRFQSAIIGTLTIPALYVLMRTLFDRTTAVIAAILLATFPPHLHFSRLALNNIADPMFGTWALAFLARGLRYQRRFDFVLAGIALGLTQYFHEAGRYLFPLLIVVWLGSAWWWHQPRPLIKKLALMCLIAMIVAAPLYYFIYSEHLRLIPRLQDSGNMKFQAVLTDETQREKYLDYSLKGAFLLQVSMPERKSMYYLGDTALILPIVVPAFLLGVALCLWHWRSPRVVLPLGVLLAIMGNSFLVESATPVRYIAIFPLLMGVAAVGLRYAGWLIEARRSHYILILLSILMATGQVHYYFGDHLENFNRQTRQQVDATDAILRSSDLAPGTVVYLVGEFDLPLYDAMLRYFADGVHLMVIPAENFTPIYVSTRIPNLDYAFFLQPGDYRSLRALQQYFVLDAPRYSPNPDVPRDQAYILYYAPLVKQRRD